MTRRSLPTIATLLAAALLVVEPATAAGGRRVAISEFTTDENQWENIRAAADFAPALQAKLAKEPAVEWVERAQLGLAQKEQELSAALGRPDLPNAIRRARWSKADWLVTGHFSSKDGTRELLLEVIDLAHADVLAERRINFPAGTKEPLRAALAHLPEMAGALREVLHAADERERAVAGLPIIAVLFFPDSEVFQREFAATLADPRLSGGPVRTLHFPRAGEALGEAELVLGGFAEDAEGAWRGIADVYAWGSFVRRESGSIDGETITDANTPEVALTAWDGRLSPMRFIEESAPVARREFEAAVTAQARRLAMSLAEAARARRPGAADEAQRARVSQALLRSAEQLEETKLSHEGYIQDPAGRRHFFNVTQTLEAACFFDPQNRAAQERLVRLHWDRKLEYAVRNRFRFWLGRSEAWGRFVERFGFPEPGPTMHEQISALMRAQPVDHERIHALMRKSGAVGLPVAREFLDSACTVAGQATLGNREEFGYPSGVPERAAAQWADDLAVEAGRRTVVVAARKDVDATDGLATLFANQGHSHFYLRDARERIELLKKTWSQLGAERQARVATARPLREDVIATFEELGRAGEVEKLFAAVPPLPPPAVPQTRPPPPRELSPEMEQRRAGDEASRLFRMSVSTTLPTALQPVIEEFDAVQKEGLFYIHDLALLAGRAWLIGEGLEQTEIAGTNRAFAATLQPTSAETTRLFSFDPVSRHFERVASTRQFMPVSMLRHEGHLWLALGKDGVATLDPATGALQRFGAGDGLDVASAYRFAEAGGRVFVTANMSDAFVWTPETKRWSAWNTEFPDYRGPRFAGDVRRLGGFGRWLALYQRPTGICDVDSPAWQRCDEQLADGAKDTFPHIRCMAADSHGLWLGGNSGLHFLDPQTGATINRLRPPNALDVGRLPSAATAVEALLKRRAELRERRERQPDAAHPLRPTSRIVGVVNALASDGDFLWVATSTDDPQFWEGYVMLLHKPSGRWIGQFRTRAITCLATDDTHLWLGCRLGYGAGVKCLLRLEKTALYSIPEDRWMADTVTDAEARGAFERLGVREQALWHFTGGAYATAAGLLAKIEPQTPETLFLQGLCHDEDGLNQPEKSRAFFTQIVTAHPGDLLAEEARKQLTHAAGSTAR